MIDQTGGDGAVDALRPLAQVLALSVLGLVVPIGILGGVTDWDGATLFVALAAASPLAYELSRPAFRPGRVGFYAFVYAMFAVVGLAQARLDVFPLPVSSTYGDSDKQFVFVLVVISVLTFEWGYRSMSLSRRGRELLDGGEPLVYDRRVFLMLVGLGLMCVLLIHVRGGVGVIFSSREAMNEAFLGVPERANRFFDAETSQVGAIELSAVRTVALALAVFAALPDSYFVPPPRLATRAAGIGLAALLAAPTSAPRTVTGAVVLAGALAAGMRRPWTSRLAMASLPLLLIFSGPSDVFRRRDRLGADASFRLGDGDFSHYQQVLNAIVHARNEGHTLGVQFAGSALGYVPSSIWSGKPVETGQLIQGPASNRNPSAPLWAEAYIDFGVVGVLVAFFLVGLAVCWGDKRFRMGSPLAVVFLASLPLLLRGSLRTYVLLVVPALAFVWFAAASARRETDRNPAGRGAGRQRSTDQHARL